MRSVAIRPASCRLSSPDALAQPIESRSATAPDSSHRSQVRPDALDVVDRLDLVGLREQDREAASPRRATLSASRARRRIVSRSAGRAGRRPHRPEPVGQPVEAGDLDEHDRGRAAVATDAGVLVGHDFDPSGSGRASPVSASLAGPRRSSAAPGRRSTRPGLPFAGLPRLIGRATRPPCRNRARSGLLRAAVAGVIDPLASPRHAWDDHGQGDRGAQSRAAQRSADT